MTRQFYISVVPLLIINGSLILGYLLFMLLGFNKKTHKALQKTANKEIIAKSLQNYWFHITEPFVIFLIKLKITPNTITIIGVIFSFLAGILFSIKAWGAAGWIMILGGVFDLFDGRIARETNTVTKSGAYLDSVMDRYSDGFVLSGLAIAFRNHWLLSFILLCFIGFFAISYAKARSEAHGVRCDVGMFQRAERIYSLSLAAIFSPIFSYYLNLSYPALLFGIIIILAIGTFATSVYRVYYSFKRVE
jgi:phosphatidylglycerophosphate synthase